ncbi:MAG: hypothetical protein KA791_14705 [Flavobacteriales bacterium]|nr:hypothetical protein [Flavobacteriales bacterium]
MDLKKHRTSGGGRIAQRLRAVYAAGLVAVCCVFNTGCLKDEVDVSALNNNPFDPGYTGPNVFSFDTTYIEPIPGTGGVRQAFLFRVNSALFLEPQAYSVYVEDELLPPADPLVHQVPPGSDVLRYYRNEFTFGQEVCLRLSLSNNTHEGRPETVCGTLQ